MANFSVLYRFIWVMCSLQLGYFAQSIHHTLLFIIPGAFMAFTSTGTIIDIENKKVRPYTSLFGFIRTGKWIEVSGFSGFKIMKSNRRYTSYSRANVRLDMNISDIKLLLVNKNGTGKVVLNRYNNFEDAGRRWMN